MNTFLRLSSIVLLFVLATAQNAAACAACYSDNTGSKMGNAANWGVIAMAIIMFIMLGAIGGFFYYLAWRAKNPLPDYDELLSEEPEHPLPDAP